MDTGGLRMSQPQAVTLLLICTGPTGPAGPVAVEIESKRARSYRKVMFPSTFSRHWGGKRPSASRSP